MTNHCNNLNTIVFGLCQLACFYSFPLDFVRLIDELCVLDYPLSDSASLAAGWPDTHWNDIINGIKLSNWATQQILLTDGSGPAKAIKPLFDIVCASPGEYKSVSGELDC